MEIGIAMPWRDWGIRERSGVKRGIPTRPR
jgi:hypothetical protein